ncbi:MAG: cytidylyltransferase domain-containing protein, partial [Gemmatimonadales bacterium]
MRVLGIIPARLGSTRLPNKPLQLLAGTPLVVRVLECAAATGLFHPLVVATDAADVVDVVA